jgi:hypothetical protein
MNSTIEILKNSKTKFTYDFIEAKKYETTRQNTTLYFCIPFPIKLKKNTYPYAFTCIETCTGSYICKSSIFNWLTLENKLLPKFISTAQEFWITNNILLPSLNKKFLFKGFNFRIASHKEIRSYSFLSLSPIVLEIKKD